MVSADIIELKANVKLVEDEVTEMVDAMKLSSQKKVGLIDKFNKINSILEKMSKEPEPEAPKPTITVPEAPKSDVVVPTATGKMKILKVDAKMGIKKMT